MKSRRAAGPLFGSVVLLGLLLLACAPAAEAPRPQPEQPTSVAPFPTQGQPRYGGVLHLAQTDDPPNWDLYSNSTTAMQTITWATYNNLIIFNPLDQQKIIPDLAERWEVSKDGKEVTFSLHKGIKFHNGAPFTSADVKFSLDWIKDPPKGAVSTRRDNLEPIERIETPDDSTVKLILKRPYAALIPMLAQGWMGIYSKSWVEAKGNDIAKKEMMGTGAFRFKEYIRGTSIEIEKNPDYWQKGVPYLDGVKRFIIRDRGTRVAALRTGQVHLLGLDALDAEDFEKAMGNEINIQRGAGVSWSTVNLNATRRPFEDARVRQAVSLAIDRPGYIKAIEHGAGRMGGYVPPSSAFALPMEELQKLPGYGPDKAADRARAKQLLTEAGYPSGFKTNFTVRTGSDNLAIYVQDQLKQIGIDAPIKFLDSGPAYDAAVKKDFDILPWGHGLALDDPDAHYSELYLCNAPRDYSGICDQKLQDLFMKQSTALDPETRKKAVWELEKYAVPLNVKIILSWNDFRVAHWKFVKGYQRQGHEYNTSHYKQVWLDK
ncbi:MAG: ABC transporter substrate-binding protein [Chloroflexi bacterium]|nr:ABC transporter substrate-binding protein [Chloroflexota bacterium]